MPKKRKIIVQVEDPKFRQLLPPYQEYHSCGPYFRPEGMYGRMYINILKGYRTGINGILYARYLLETKLGRRLKDGCEVDHIDGYPWNDLISNLQELPARMNSAKGRATLFKEIQHAKTHILLKCPTCGNWFERKKSCIAGSLTFCSHRCSGRFVHIIHDRSTVHQETRPIEMPSLENIPHPYHEPFEKFSLPRLMNKTVYLCECGTPLPSKNMHYCDICRMKLVKALDYRSDNPGVIAAREEIVAAIREEYTLNGKIAMWRFCKRFGLSDRGLAKRIDKLFGKPYKEVIAEVCNGK